MHDLREEFWQLLADSRRYWQTHAIFWAVVVLIYLCDYIPIWGVGFGIDDFLYRQQLPYWTYVLPEFVEKHTKSGVFSGEGFRFMFFTVTIGFGLAYLHLLLFRLWIDFDTEIYSGQLRSWHQWGSAFAKSLVLLATFGVLGGFLFMWVVDNYNTDILGKTTVVAQLKFMRQLPETMQICWGLLGLDYFIRSRAKRIQLQASLQKITAENQHLILQKEEQAVRLLMLNQRMKPHFMMNVFTSLYAQLRKQDADLSRKVIKAADIMRHTLHMTQEGNPTIELSEELTYLQSLIDLKQDYRSDIQLTCTKSVGNADGLAIESGIIDEFVINAYKYCSARQPQQPHLTIELKLQQSVFEMTVVNSVDNQNSTIQAEKNREHIGLANIRRRLEARYPDNRSQLTIRSEINQFTIHLSLTLSTWKHPTDAWLSTTKPSL